MKNIFIGVDGGGTKTKVLIEDAEGNFIAQAIGKPSNIRYSIDNAWQAILETIQTALQLVHLSLEDKHYTYHLGLGLAGTEAKEVAQDFLNRSHGFHTIQLASDAHTACLGAHAGKEGAVICIGTGVIGYQIQAGKFSRVSGWGFPHDDMGGGAWLGLEAARHTFMWLDHRAEKNGLVEDIFNYFNRDLDTFVAWANKASATEFARLAPLVINHGQQELALAVRIMKKAAHAIEKIVSALKKSQGNSTILPLCLVGGIAPFIQPWLNEVVQNQIVPCQADAAKGGIILIREKMQDKIS